MNGNSADLPNLVLLSGLLCDEEMWDDVRTSLTHLANIKLFSFPGFSSIEQMAEHVLAGTPPRFALAGHSMGGRIALEIVRRDPDRVTGLALLNTGIHPPASHEPQSRAKLVAIAQNEGMSALAAQWLPPMLDRERSVHDPVAVRLTRMIERNTPESFAAQIHALLNRPDAGGVLRTVRVPLLLVSGSADTWSPPKQHAEMCGLCPGAKLVTVEGAGHMSPVERPEVVATALAQWMHQVINIDPATSLTSLDKLLIRDACAQQIYRYARLNDAGNWEALTAIFSQDGILSRPSHPDKPIRGRTEIIAAFESRPPRLTRHFISNVEVTVESSSRAHAFSAVVLCVGELSNGVPTITSTSTGHFEDSFMKVDGQWLFTQRRGHTTMQGTAPTGEGRR